jgi:hypothetical protein
MTFDAQSLYELVPAIYRIRDAERGGPLERLVEILADPVVAFEENLEQLRDDLFIETCADWVVPYIGELVGHRPLHPAWSGSASPRAEVANAIRYRRRKGTASMLEELARNVTGWNARVVEFFERLAWNQHVNHPRVTPPRGGTLTVRNHESCELIGYANGAFDSTARFADVRDPVRAAGRYGVSKIGLFLWRLNAYPIVNGDAHKEAAGQFRFNPLGLDAPLFNVPAGETEIAQLAAQSNVPGTLRRRALHDDVEALRAAIAAGQPRPELHFTTPRVLQVILNDEAEPVPPQELLVCNLEGWDRPPTSRDYPDPSNTPVPMKIRAAIDPELGRVTVPVGAGVREVRVSYAYGFSAGIGGGPYNRRDSSTSSIDRDISWQLGVSRDAGAAAEQVVPTLTEAVNRWNDQPAGTCGAIAILDSRTYEENLVTASKIRIPEGSCLLIVAASWPEVESATGERVRLPGHLTRHRQRPVLAGKLSVQGTAGTDDQPGRLLLDGLLIDGAVTVLAGNLGALTLSHCTVVPGNGLTVNSSASDENQNNDLELRLDHSICGTLSIPGSRAHLHVLDSIVSSELAADDAAVAIGGEVAHLHVERSTVFGSVAARHLDAENALFTGTVAIERRQQGCVRFCYLPPGSTPPRTFRCQPQLEIAVRIARAETEAGTKLDPAAREQIRRQVEARIVPSFTAVVYGHPAFGQLHSSSPVQLRTGAEDDAEMGAFHDLFQPQREANLRARLDEYLRLGLTAGIFYAS